MAELSKRHKRALKLKRRNTILFNMVRQQQSYINALLSRIHELESPPQHRVEIVPSGVQD